MKEMIVLFSGGMGAGKDTMRVRLLKYLTEVGESFKEFHFSFADPLKDELNAILEALQQGKESGVLARDFNLTDEEVKTLMNILSDVYPEYPSIHARSRHKAIREALQYLGTDVRRFHDPDYWVNLAKEIIKEKQKDGYLIMITDGRFENEFRAVQDLGGAAICLKTGNELRLKRMAERDGVAPDPDALNHKSEQDWKTYKGFDVVVDSTNLTEQETLDEILRQLKEQGISLRGASGNC